DAEGEPALGQDLPDRRGAPPRPDQVQANLQRMLADRAARPPIPSPVPTRPDRHNAAGRLTAIGCLKNRGRYTMLARPILVRALAMPMVRMNRPMRSRTEFRSAVKRPGLDQALGLLDQGDVLIVWRLDRLGWP